MRNLKYFLSLCALALAPTPGCTVEATTGGGFGGEFYASFESGGAATSSGGASTQTPGAAGTSAATVAAGASSTVGGAAALGGAPSVAGSPSSTVAAGSPASTGVAGTSAAAGAQYTTANCPMAAAMTPPAAIADITAACVKCLYTTGCSDAVDCHNEPGCAVATLKALECVQLQATFNDLAYGDIVDDPLCDEAKGVAPDKSAITFPVRSTDPTAWTGAVLPVNGAAWYTNCVVECTSPNPNP